MRGSPAYTSKRVGVASLTYVPALEGYWRQAPEVIRVHLASLRADAVASLPAGEPPAGP